MKKDYKEFFEQMKIAGGLAAKTLDEIASYIKPGISTDKLHVRGPVGTQHLTSYKYVVQGNGQIRL